MKKLYKGNEAIAEAAVAAGCKCYFGYPITPQNEIPEFMSWRLPEVGGHCVQAESEVGAINMVYGAAGAGARTMTSTSSPGMSLKCEGFSYLANAEVPCVIVNIVRCGPGLGGILPSQGDYMQAVKGGGHGDYHMFVYAPSTVQEAADLTYKAFDIAEKYRCPVVILSDGSLGQMMEPVEMPDFGKPKQADISWAASGNNGGKKRVISSMYVDPLLFERHIHKMFAKYERMAAEDTMAEEYKCGDAELILTAYGISARVCKAAVDILRQNGVKAGLIRPITLFPFPAAVFEKYAAKASVKQFLCCELSMGQMLEDVKLSIGGKKPVDFYGRCGGVIMTAEEVVEYVRDGKKPANLIECQKFFDAVKNAPVKKAKK